MKNTYKLAKFMKNTYNIPEYEKIDYNYPLLMKNAYTHGDELEEAKRQNNGIFAIEILYFSSRKAYI
jgi:hypothetical protein